MTTTNPATVNVPRIWAGCESCYAAGRLVGVWVDAVYAADTTAEQIHAGSGVDWRAEACEEFVCMDNDGLPVSGEPSLEGAARWGEIYEEVGDDQWPALCAWVRSGAYITEGNTDYPSVSDFEEAYCGTWDSFADYAEDLAEGTGMLEAVPEELRGYVDIRGAWARDLAFDYSVGTADCGGVYVFRSL